MKQCTVNILDERDMSVIDMLTSVNVPRTAATMLVYLQQAGPSISRDIEVGSGLRQPEVSKAVDYLNAKEWITTEVTMPSGGRPCNIYTLVKSFSDIIDELKTDQIDHMKAVEAAVAKSREMLA